MRTSAVFSAPRSFASFTGGTGLPMDGPAVPDWDVEKKWGLMRSKSCSSRMRCTSTEPTIPRQPISPTCIALDYIWLDGTAQEPKGEGGEGEQTPSGAGAGVR